VRACLGALLAFLVALLPAVSAADSATPTVAGPASRDVYRGGYFLDGLRDAGRTFTAPVRWNGRDWAIAGGTAAATWGLMTCDTGVRRAIRSNRTRTTKRLAAFGRGFGEWDYMAGGLIVTGVGADLAGASRLQRAAWLGLESFGIASGLWTTLLKCLAHRHRPYAGDGAHRWDGPGRPVDDSNLSFPSGHAATAWSVLTAVSATYDDSPYVAPFAYGIATLTALSRVHDDKHWASDVFFSSTLSFFVARAVVKWHSRAGSEPLTPAMLPGGGVGTAVTFRF